MEGTHFGDHVVEVIEDGVLRLWMLPIYLRTEKKYYEDSDAETRRLLDFYWKTSSHCFGSREEFDNSTFVRDVRMQKHFPPWCFNDIIGWINVDASPGTQTIHLELFLTKARPSRRLKQKIFVLTDFKYVFYRETSTNEEVRQRVFKTADELVKACQRIRRFHVNLASWERQLAYTDILGLLHDAPQRIPSPHASLSNSISART